jgi:adenylate kinase
VSNERYRTVLLFGAPGTGKGTQGKILGAIPGFHHLSCGDVFRTLNPNSEVGKIFMEYSSRGELVPDDVTIRMWRENIEAKQILSIFRPQDDLLVLDGIPRNAEQARLMDAHIDVLSVVHLMCRDEDKMIDRLRRRALKENRADDAKEEVIRRRWEVYERETRPVLDHYDASIVAEVDALGTPGEVLQKVLEVVVPVRTGRFENPL